MRPIKEGDRVRLKATPKDTGVVDELYEEGGIPCAVVVWDATGCCGEGHLTELELIDDV